MTNSVTRGSDMICLEEVRTDYWGPCTLELLKKGISVIAGPSGSGKSTLLHEVLERECQTRFQVLASCDALLSHQIDISFLNNSTGPRPNGRIDGLPLLFSPPPFDPNATLATLFEFEKILPALIVAQEKVSALSVSEQTDLILNTFPGRAIIVSTTPRVFASHEEKLQLVAEGASIGISHIVIDNKISHLENAQEISILSETVRLALVADRLKVSSAQRLRIEQALHFVQEIGDGASFVAAIADILGGDIEIATALSFLRSKTDRSPETPKFEAWCDQRHVEELEKYRFDTASAVKLFQYSLHQLLENLSLDSFLEEELIYEGLKGFRARLEYGILLGFGSFNLWQRPAKFSSELLHKLRLVLTPVPFLDEVGYVFDTPIYGYHPRDIQEIISFLVKLSKNSGVIVADNNEEALRIADHSVVLSRFFPPPHTIKDSFKEDSLAEPSNRSLQYRSDWNGKIWDFQASTMTFLVGDAAEMTSLELETRLRNATWNVLGEPHQEPPIIVFARTQRKKTLQKGTIGGALGITNELCRFFSLLPLAKVNGLTQKDFRDSASPMKQMKLVLYRGLSFHDYLPLPLSQVSTTFAHHPTLKHTFSSLGNLNLLHLSLERSLASLSDGELSRLELVRLVQNSPRQSIFIFSRIFSSMDEYLLPRIKEFFREVLARGATVLSIESNPLLASWADRTISLGDEM